MHSPVAPASCEHRGPSAVRKDDTEFERHAAAGHAVPLGRPARDASSHGGEAYWHALHIVDAYLDDHLGTSETRALGRYLAQICGGENAVQRLRDALCPIGRHPQSATRTTRTLKPSA